MSEIKITPPTENQVRDDQQSAEIAHHFEDVNAQLLFERENRITRDSQLQTEINNLRDDLQNQSETQSNTSKDLQNQIDAEIENRSADSKELQTKIDTEKLLRDTADENLRADFNSKIETEKNQRAAADVQLQKNIDAEINNRSNAVSNLRSDINSATDKKLAALESSLKKYSDDKILDVENNLNDFTAPTSTAEGKRGLVPNVPSGDDLKILTSKGWRTAQDAQLTISTLPSQQAPLTFNAQTQYPTWLNFDSKKLKIEGQISAKNAGTYTVTFTPLDLYIWADTLDQTPKSQTWKINILRLQKPFAEVTEFDCDGSTHTLQVQNFNSTFINRTGTISASESGDYSANFALKDTTNSTWADSTTATVVINWCILIREFAKPTAAVTSFDWDGSTKNLQVQNFDEKYMTRTGTISASNAGNYSVTYALKNKNVSKWTDGTTTDVVITWTINRKRLTAAQSTFAQVGTLTYNKNTQYVTISNFDDTLHTLSGTTSSKNAGTFTAVVALKNQNHAWADGTTAAKNVQWSIQKLKCNKPTATTTHFIFDGNEKNLNPTYNHDYILAENTTATAAGNYRAKFTLLNSNCAWQDGSQDIFYIDWSIGAQEVSIPAATDTIFTYNGQIQSLSISNFNTNYMTMEGQTSATDAGDYLCKFILKDKTTTCWQGGSTNDVVINWKINKATLSFDESNFYLTTTPVYSGNEIFVKDYIANYDPAKHILGGTVKRTDAGGEGNTNATLKPGNNYTWNDGGTSYKNLAWYVARAPIDAPSVNEAVTLTYNGNTQSPTLIGFDSNKMTLSSDTSKINAGTYNLEAAPLNNYCWKDKSTDKIVLTWRIRGLPVAKPVVKSPNDVFTFSGKEISFFNAYNKFNVLTYDEENITLGGQTSGFHYSGKSYVAVFTLNDSNHEWEDGTANPIKYYFHIGKNNISLTSLVSSEKNFQYDGEPHTVNLHLDSPLSTVNPIDLVKVTGDITATERGNYSFTLDLLYPSDSYFFAGGQMLDAPITFYWSIGTTKITKPTLAQAFFDYDNTTKTISVTGFDSVTMTKSGTESAKKRGIYTVTFALKDKEGTCWDDGSVEDITLTWTIGITRVAKPYLTNGTTEFEYTGGSKKLQVTGYDSNKMSMSGYLSATDAGDYQVTFKLLNTTEYIWEDSSIADVVFDWKITPAAMPASKDFKLSGAIAFTYTGSQITVGTAEYPLANYDSKYHLLTGDTTGIDANFAHNVVVAPNANYTWSDGTTNAFRFMWTIKRLKFPKPYLEGQTEFEYNRREQGGKIVNQPAGADLTKHFDSGGEVYGTNAGTYTAWYHLKNTHNTCWDDDTKDDVNLSITIKKYAANTPYDAGRRLTNVAEVHTPRLGFSTTGYEGFLLESDVTFGGDYQVIPANIPDSQITITGNIKEWHSTCTLTLNDTDNFYWRYYPNQATITQEWTIWDYVNSPSAKLATQSQILEVQAAIIDLQEAVLDIYSSLEEDS